MKKIKNLFSAINTKITVLFLLLFIPLFLAGFSIYKYGYTSVKQEITDSSTSQLSLYAHSLSDEITRIQLSCYQLASNEDINYLANAYSIMGEYERSQYILRTAQLLSILQNSSSFIESAAIYIPAMKKTISVNDSEPGIIFEDYMNHQGKKDSQNNSIYYEKTQICLYIQCPIILTSESDLSELFVLKITFSNRAIEEMLKYYTQFPDSYIILSSDDGSFFLTSDLPSEKESPSELMTTVTTVEHTGLSLTSCISTAQLFGKIKDYRFIWFIYFLLALLIIVLFSFALHHMLNRPIRYLMNAIKTVESGNYQISSKPYQSRDEFRTLYKAFAKMAHNLDDLIHQVYEQKILTQKAELKQLQSQINPHFLYNSFFNIYRLAKDEDCDNIIVFSQYLGKYYQYITRNASSEVPLIAEYEHAQNYCNIQLFRFHDRLQIEISPLPERFHSLMVPRIIIQPIIENAFEHGLQNVDAPCIKIDILEENQVLTIRIQDNGPKLSPEIFENLSEKLNTTEQTLETTALINIHRRLRMKYGPFAGITLTQEGVCGLTVSIHIPIN